jgi:hypothetical protein
VAIVVRYFSTTGAGAEDGTTWADRAPFIVSGAYNTIITAFDFSGSDSLEVRLGPGTYSSAPQLDNNDFTVALPRPKNPCLIHGCDSSGNRIVPDTSWNCCEGSLDTTGYPVIEIETNLWGATNTHFRCLYITGTTGNVIVAPGLSASVDFCRIERTGNNNVSTSYVCGGAAGAGSHVSNCHIICTSTTFTALSASAATLFSNCRFEGNASATSGDRRGIVALSTGALTRPHNQNCIINCPGSAIFNNASTTNSGMAAHGYTIVNCATAAGAAIEGSAFPNTGTGSNYNTLAVTNCFIANCGTGISTPNIAVFVSNTRLRNTTNYSVPANSIIADDYTAAGNDTDEFVNAAGGDYRLKSTSSYWGKSIGAGDEPPTGGTSKPVNPFTQTVIA